MHLQVLLILFISSEDYQLYYNLVFVNMPQQKKNLTFSDSSKDDELWTRIAELTKMKKTMEKDIREFYEKVNIKVEKLSGGSTSRQASITYTPQPIRGPPSAGDKISSTMIEK